MSLQEIQTELHAPKGQTNTFGKYKYRSCEDIVEAVKPVLAKHSASLMLSDDIQMVGARIYIKATATITFKDGSHVSAVAFARESDGKKGMDDAQLTGACSSYARKYALNGLLAIDDTKDADTQDNSVQQKAAPKKEADPLANLQHKKKIIQDCSNIDELKVVWDTLKPEEKTALEAFKNGIKSKLTEVAA